VRKVIRGSVLVGLAAEGLPVTDRNERARRPVVDVVLLTGKAAAMLARGIGVGSHAGGDSAGVVRPPAPDTRWPRG
jgi:hypothetical protein